MLKLLWVTGGCPKPGSQLPVLAQVPKKDLELLVGWRIRKMHHTFIVDVTVNIGMTVGWQCSDAAQTEAADDYEMHPAHYKPAISILHLDHGIVSIAGIAGIFQA